MKVKTYFKIAIAGGICIASGCYLLKEISQLDIDFDKVAQIVNISNNIIN